MSQPSGRALHKGTGCGESGNTTLSSPEESTGSPGTQLFRCVFRDPGWTDILFHEINNTPRGTIVWQRPYWVLEACRQVIEEEVQLILHLGVIEESQSLWSSPIVMMPKKDGWFCWMRCPNSIDTHVTSGWVGSLGALGRPPGSAEESLDGNTEGWTGSKPKEVPPGPVGGTVPGLQDLQRTHQVTRTEIETVRQFNPPTIKT